VADWLPRLLAQWSAGVGSSRADHALLVRMEAWTGQTSLPRLLVWALPLLASGGLLPSLSPALDVQLSEILLRALDMVLCEEEEETLVKTQEEEDKLGKKEKSNIYYT